MWASAEEASSCIRRLATSFHRARTAKTSVTSRRILVEQMCVLRASTFAEVLDLHDFGKSGDVDCRFGFLSVVMLFKDLFVLHTIMSVQIV